MTPDCEGIEARIAEWHDSPAGSPAAAQKLHEFLGMSWENYRMWVESNGDQVRAHAEWPGCEARGGE